MANCLTHQFCTATNLPLKVQAHKIKNLGAKPIYIMDIVDDLPVPPGSLLAFSLLIIVPGQESDLAGNPFMPRGLSGANFDITIHSDDSVDVEVTSDGFCDQWAFDLNHPWNGGLMPNGQQTQKYSLASNQVTSVNGVTGPVTSILPLPAGMAGQVYSGYGGWVNTTIPWNTPPEHITVDINISKFTPKCTCGTASLKDGGKHSSWCDLETSNKV